MPWVYNKLKRVSDKYQELYTIYLVAGVFLILNMDRTQRSTIVGSNSRNTQDSVIFPREYYKHGCLTGVMVEGNTSYFLLLEDVKMVFTWHNKSSMSIFVFCALLTHVIFHDKNLVKTEKKYGFCNTMCNCFHVMFISMSSWKHKDYRSIGDGSKHSLWTIKYRCANTASH